MEIKRIFVIESVFDNTHLHDAGDFFEAQIVPLCQNKGIKFCRIKYSYLNDLLQAIELIKETSSQEGATAVHIICHGANDKRGLAYKVDTSYLKVVKKLNWQSNFMYHAWEHIRSELAEVNNLSNGNLFLSMCVCFGNIIFETCKSPFAKYIIAGNGELHLDDIKQTFVDVYKELISSSDIKTIETVIEYANQRNNGRSQLALYEGMQKKL